MSASRPSALLPVPRSDTTGWCKPRRGPGASTAKVHHTRTHIHTVHMHTPPGEASPVTAPMFGRQVPRSPSGRDQRPCGPRHTCWRGRQGGKSTVHSVPHTGWKPASCLWVLQVTRSRGNVWAPACWYQGPAMEWEGLCPGTQGRDLAQTRPCVDVAQSWQQDWQLTSA